MLIDDENTALDVAERGFVDSMAMMFEQRGLSPVAGRILGRLLIARPDEQSSKELAAYIEASKGSISAQTQFLIQGGFIEKLRRPGSRETWYTLRDGVWLGQLQREANGAAYGRRLAEAILEAQRASGHEPSSALLQFHSVNRFFEKRMPELIEEWKQAHGHDHE